MQNQQEKCFREFENCFLSYRRERLKVDGKTILCFHLKAAWKHEDGETSTEENRWKFAGKCMRAESILRGEFRAKYRIARHLW